MRMLKRGLPFVLTACAGILVSNLATPVKSDAADGEYPLNSETAQRSYAFYYQPCRCMVWTTDAKQWANIKNLPKPNFTEAARRNRYTGGMQVRVLLGADGKVAAVDPYGTIPHELTGEIVRAARAIEFTPASVFSGTPEAIWVTVGYSFKTTNNGFFDVYETGVEVFDHFDVNRNGVEIRLERVDF